MPSPYEIEDWREILILEAALAVGLLEAFAAPDRPERVAEQIGLDTRAARIVAAALVDFGYLDGRGGLMALTDRGRTLLGPQDDGRDLAAEVGLSARAIADHLGLARTLLDGEPRDDVSAGSPEALRRFARAMRHVAARRAPETVEALGPPLPGGRLLDVGGAPGTYARALADAGWSVTVMDLPDALAAGARELTGAGIAIVAGDALEALPDGPWQAIYLGNLTHLFGPDDVAGLIARAGAALAPGGLLAVQDILRGHSPQAARFAVLMLLATPEGDTYGEGAYRDWMEAAGCPLERIVALDEGWHHLLLGRRIGG